MLVALVATHATCRPAFCDDLAELPPGAYEIVPQTDERGAKSDIDAIDLRDIGPEQAKAFGSRITTRHYGYNGPRNILTFATDFATPALLILQVRAASAGGADLLITIGDAAYLQQWREGGGTIVVGKPYGVAIPPGQQQTRVEAVAGTVVVDRYVVLPDAGAARDWPVNLIEPYSSEMGTADGYRGIWYYNQPSKDQYVYKYSGGLGTYTAKHIPLAVYSPEANKTFFVYGGSEEDHRRLLIMASYYDHETGRVPRPTILCDKRTGDAHDNPVISIDDAGYIWVFASSHGTARPSFIYKSAEPYSTARFDLIKVTNFSYPQVHHIPGKGFLFLQTIYNGGRRLYSQTSSDGARWTEPVEYAGIHQGHYQVTGRCDDRVASAFNYHPQDKGLNWRTNLYYIETADMGQTWTTVTGEPVEAPLRQVQCPALVHDFQAQGLNVYMKDINFDAQGNPIILVVTSKGYASGPPNDPRTWTTVHWNGEAWQITKAFSSDNNYDMGSLYIEDDGTWCIIGPTEHGPQAYNPGGEVAMWRSADQGDSWLKVRQLTYNSPYNHTYVRRSVNAHPEFYAFWADGHGREPSESRLYFCDKSGERVFRLPTTMDAEFARPVPVFRQH